MGGETLLKQIAKDVAVLRERIIVVEEELRDISEDIHELRPEYLKKLKKIKKEGTISQKELEKRLRIKL